MTLPTTVLNQSQRTQWDAQGFLRIDGFAEQATCDAMLDRARELAATATGIVLPEANRPGEVSKIFKLHRDPVFEAFARRDDLLELLAGLMAPELDVFLSQFIFKTPGAWGQPWHQDSYYFPFDPPRPVVGAWLAVTEATLENGCLHVLPGSHHEPVHEHVRDRRPGANYGYVEIIDHDLAGSVPVLMQPGDLLLFDSHLMHRSTDNVSDGIRGAIVYHYAAAGTVDRTDERGGVNDWMPVRRLK